MLTATITNTSGLTIQPAAVAAAAGVYPIPAFIQLPGCLSWLTIANTASKSVIVTVADLEAPATTAGFAGQRVKDVLQQLIQGGKITLTYVALGATDTDTFAAAIKAQN